MKTISFETQKMALRN